MDLGRAVWKALSPANSKPLAAYRIGAPSNAYEQGLPAQLVIGIPDGADSPDGHAWVEVRGIDVGPALGRGSRLELTRYGVEGPVAS